LAAILASDLTVVFGYTLDLMMGFGVVFTDFILDRTFDIVNRLTLRFSL
jgi:hypothetical protein